ncbi:MAG TPA: glycoside hydrolase family 2 TIM barrel-domain containing protein [Baekduia sp.]|jgi:hypothetical protein
MRRTGTKLAVAGLLGLAILVVGAAVVATALSSRPHGEALVPAAAHGGPPGRQSLVGPWIRAMDPDDAGGAAGFGAGNFAGALVTVPDVANAATVTGAAGIAAFAGSIAWYRTELTAPKTGSYALRFESVHYKAQVWLDGQLLGTHTGEYLPFEYTLRLRAGVPHRLVVRADYRSPTLQKREGWHSTWFNFGGINREVTLRPLAPTELAAPTLTTRLDGGAAVVDASIDVHNRAGSARDVQVRGTLRHAGGGPDLRFPKVHLGPGEVRRVSTEVRIAHPVLWAPGSPSMYALHLTAGAGEGGWDDAVGLRQVSWKDGELLLNGQRLRLHGASLNEDIEGRGDALTPADMDAMVHDLQAVGANATRAQHALSPPLLERLDRAGILVWQGVGPVEAPGAWTAQSPALAHEARERVRTTVRQERMHPSVIAWNLANEIAGNGHDPTEVAYVRDMAREIHRDDPGRLVALDIWGSHPPKVPGAIYADVDAVALTNYVGWYTGVDESKAHIASRLHDTAAGFTKLFAGKVLIVSEFGAEANAANTTTAPGGYDYQSWLLDLHIKTYAALPKLSGMLVWNIRDFAVSPGFAGGSISRVVPGIHIERGLNTKGLFDYAGKPKPAAAAVRRAFEPLGTGLG